MTVAELRKILDTMKDTDEVVFQEKRIDAWSGHADGYITLDIDRIVTKEIVEEEEKEEDRLILKRAIIFAEGRIKEEEEVIQRCRSEKSIEKHQKEIIKLKNRIAEMKKELAK